MRIPVRCGCCRGTGRVELSGTYAKTLELLKERPVPISGADLARLAGCSNEAMCNRLRRLERHALAMARRKGREVLWTAIK